RLRADIAQRADAERQRRDGEIVGRFEDGDDVVLSLRPVDVLDGRPAFLRHLLEGVGAFGRVLGFADSLLGEASKNAIGRHSDPPSSIGNGLLPATRDCPGAAAPDYPPIGRGATGPEGRPGPNQKRGGPEFWSQSGSPLGLSGVSEASRPLPGTKFTSSRMPSGSSKTK